MSFHRPTLMATVIAVVVILVGYHLLTRNSRKAA